MKLLALTLGFNAFWFLCVVGRDEWLWLTFPVLAIHLALVPRSLPMALSVSMLGITLDTLMIHFDLFAFDHGVMPFWLMSLWMGFGFYCWHLKPSLANMPILVVMLGGATSAAASYYAGFKLGAVDFPFGDLLTLSLVFTSWAMLCAGLHWWSSREVKSHEAV
ncbi:DUF2878 domain-containing protein [Thaumasiovibrio subtropicus]|uniref:DUF2878 domain-containing protein n=1 Tax=Thaumasiovibrio subtropicus TaxID=1891207 RepID=UPI000B3575A5|nr:DUF2878 family protein [Thaumasiovibrio subtropicus]